MSVHAPLHVLGLDPAYASLKQYLIESTGLAYYADKDNDLAARISARLSQLTLTGCGAYLALLKNREAGESERHLLIGQLTIGETYFFRHTEQFDALRDVVLPDLIERNQSSRTLRIWSAGCAIGAEPYSLAILLKRHFADRVAGWDIQILGTDINQGFLARAERGTFDERALRSTADDEKRQWFSPSGGSWTIAPAIKEWVSFQYHNLVEHPYPSIVHGISALDLILCRNVMIYFDWEVIQRILGRFHECLVDGGWLAVGHAESNTEFFGSYRTVNAPGATVYQKQDGRPAAGHPAVANPPAQLWPPWPPAGPVQQPWVPPALPVIPETPPPSPDQQHRAPPSDGLPVIRRLADEGNWKEASRACEQFIEHDRLNPIVHFYQALIMEQMRRHPDAERAFRRALYLDRTFVFAHYHLALLLRKTGRLDGAIQSLHNVRSLLSRMDKHKQIAGADGITADDLRQLTEMHLDLWQP